MIICGYPTLVYIHWVRLDRLLASGKRHGIWRLAMACWISDQIQSPPCYDWNASASWFIFSSKEKKSVNHTEAKMSDIRFHAYYQCCKCDGKYDTVNTSNGQSHPCPKCGTTNGPHIEVSLFNNLDFKRNPVLIFFKEKKILINFHWWCLCCQYYNYSVSEIVLFFISFDYSTYSTTVDQFHTYNFEIRTNGHHQHLAETEIQSNPKFIVLSLKWYWLMSIEYIWQNAIGKIIGFSLFRVL